MREVCIVFSAVLVIALLRPIIAMQEYLLSISLCFYMLEWGVAGILALVAIDLVKRKRLRL